MVERYGNPHSRTHEYGWETEASVETARQVKYFSHILCCIQLIY